jgi:hypothetical protein
MWPSSGGALQTLDIRNIFDSPKVDRDLLLTKMALGSIQPLTEMSSTDISLEVKAAGE